jgi:hypothetical protein
MGMSFQMNNSTWAAPRTLIEAAHCRYTGISAALTVLSLDFIRFWDDFPMLQEHCSREETIAREKFNAMTKLGKNG